MSEIKVMMADDSFVVRRILKDVLEKHDRIKVVCAARHGAEAVAAFPSVAPDVVILDVEMPVMDGIEAAAAIRAIDANVPILMFSSLTSRGAGATLDALTQGANDYVTKPAKVGHVDEAIDHIQTQLIPRVISWGDRKLTGQPTRPSATRPSATRPSATRATTTPAAKAPECQAVDLVAIGISTGGPNALASLVPELSPSIDFPIVIVQHMPPIFTQLLAERLNEKCPLQVREATEGAIAEPGTVWIAPGGQHLVVAKENTKVVLHLNEQPPENSCRPAVDVMFRSAAQHFPKKTLAVVMTGMGKDGLEGAKALKQAGSSIVVQDRESSVVWGMPGVVFNEGLTQLALPPQQLGQRISQHSKITRSVRREPVRN